MTGLTVRLLATGLLILLTALCNSGSESVSTTSVTEPSPVTEATSELGQSCRGSSAHWKQPVTLVRTLRSPTSSSWQVAQPMRQRPFAEARA
jgi:hypothetical protein